MVDHELTALVCPETPGPPRPRTAVNTPMHNRPATPATGLRVPAVRPDVRGDRTLARSLRRATILPTGRQDMPTTFNSCI